MAPPPYYQNAPKKNRTGLIIGLVLGGIVVCCIGPLALIGGGGFLMFQKGKDLVKCALAFKMVHTSIEDYAKAHGGKLPDAAKWQDEVTSYYVANVRTHKSDFGPFEAMDAASPWGCTDDQGRLTGMGFNSDLSGKKIDDIKEKVTTILLFEVAKASLNAHEP